MTNRSRSPSRRNGLKGAALFAVLALLLAACGDNSTTPQPGEDDAQPTQTEAEAAEETVIPVGYLANLTGAAASYGNPFNNGLTLAMEDIESSGFLAEHGARLELMREDTGSEPTNAVTIFNEFVDAGAPIAVSDSMSPIALAVGPIANDTETAFINGAGSGSPEEDFEFHLADLHTQYIAIAEDLVERGGPRVAAFVVQDNPAFPLIASNLEEGLAEQGGELVHEESLAADDTNFSGGLANIEQANPDVVFLSALAEQSGNILAQMEQAGGFEDVLRSVESGGNPQSIVDIAGSAAEGTLLRPAWVPGTPGSEEFEAAYQEQHGETPVTYSALGYQTGWIIAEAVRSTLADGADVTGEELRTRIPAASQSEQVREHGIVPDLVLNPDGQATWPGVLAELTQEEPGGVRAIEE